MGTMTGTALIERITDTLQDKDNIRWPRLELLRYINDGQREVVSQRPDSSSKSQVVLLAQNTKQTLPADGVRLIEVERNMGVDGLTPGRAIRLTGREVLDAQVPNWHVTPTSAVVSHFMFDIRKPREYFVYPLPTASVYVEINYSAAPTDLAAEASTIYLDDIWANALIAYAIMRGYQKDEDYANNANAAAAWGSIFMQSINARTPADAGINPNNNLGADQSR